MKKFNDVLIYFFFVFILTLIAAFISKLTMDGIWNFGFSYSIANGYIPYNDFNMVVGPLYNLLIAAFLKLFGNYIIVFQIANSAIISLFLVPIYHRIKNNVIYLVMFLGILTVMYSYNTFCAFLVIGILLLEDSKLKYKDIIIGLLIGIIIMTKHNIGLAIAFVAFIISKNKLKLVLGLSIPIIIVCLYLCYNNAFLSYLDFCYLGLGNFMNNFYFEWSIIIAIFLIVICLIRRYVLTNDKKVLYLLVFQIINFPLFDFNHFMISVIPVVYYVFLTINKRYLDTILRIFIIAVFLILSFSRIFDCDTTNIKFLKYNRVPSGTDSYLKGMGDYIKEKQKDHSIYLFLSRSYMIRIYLNDKLTFTDLINEGNLGRNENKYIQQIDNNCKEKKCLFILDLEYFNGKADDLDSQINRNFKNYVIENGYYLETLKSGDRVYINYEIKLED